MQKHRDNPNSQAAYVLKGAAALFAILGGSFMIWVAAQWVKFPEARATQFGFEAPLWPALELFLLVAISAVVGLFWTAAKRIEQGEPLFRQRSRRRYDWTKASNGTTTDKDA